MVEPERERKIEHGAPVYSSRIDIVRIQAKGKQDPGGQAHPMPNIGLHQVLSTA